MQTTDAVSVSSKSFLSSALRAVGDYVQLTKPRIVLLFGITGLAAMIAVPGASITSMKLWMVFWGSVLVAGSANALNQFYDRDIDSVMERTKSKRPIPQGRITPTNAMIFSLLSGALGLALLYSWGNGLAFFFGAFTIGFYVLIYTAILKRRTPYNIVIGGAAGATAPLIGWAALTGEVTSVPFLMFLIIFMWTPPHFWALALCVKDEYSKVSVPMLPVVAGEEVTRDQILWYSFTLLPITIALGLVAGFGWTYHIASAVLGIEFVRRAVKLYREKTTPAAWKMFGYSIVYLLALFTFVIVDNAVSSSEAHAAEQTPIELKDIGIEEHLGSHVDLNLTFRNEKGETVPLRSVMDGKKPTLLFLAYYECPNLCGLFLNGATEMLKKLQWTAGKEFNIVTVSIDPSESPELASDKKDAQLAALGKPDSAAGWHFWVNDVTADKEASNSNVKTLANAVGFRYKWDKSQEQYAHAAAIVVLTPDARISRYLYGIEFHEKDVKLALTEAGGNKIGTMFDRFMLYCYNYDPRTRKYGLYARNMMKAGGGFTVLCLGGLLLVGNRRRRPKRKI